VSKTNKKGKKQPKMVPLEQRSSADLKKLLAKLQKQVVKVDKKYNKLTALVEDVPGQVDNALSAYLDHCGNGDLPSFDVMADFSEALALASSDLDEVLEQLEELDPERDALIAQMEAARVELETRTGYWRPVHCPTCAKKRGVAIPKKCPHVEVES